VNRGRADGVLRHSIIDRLTGGARPGADIRIGVRDLVHAVRRDIEWLLNSRRLLDEELADLPEARRSILAYGIPDFTQFAASSEADRRSICDLIAEAVRTFEPRLDPRSIAVEAVPDKGDGIFRMGFRISGVLHVEPIHEPVAFDTSIEMDSGAVQIRAAD